MWIWYVSHSRGQLSRGSSPAPAAAGSAPSTMKAGDGSRGGRSSPRVGSGAARRRAARLRLAVRLRGRPAPKPRSGPRLSTDGADCLVIDAESQYEGKYAAAETYITRCGSGLGSSFPSPWPVSPTLITTPAFPTRSSSGRAVPTTTRRRCTGRRIGTSVDAVFAHTYAYNRLWGLRLPRWARPTKAPGGGKSFVSAAWPELRRGAKLVGLAGNEPRTWSALGPVSADPATDFRPVISQPTLRRGTAATWWSGRRSTCARPSPRNWLSRGSSPAPPPGQSAPSRVRTAWRPAAFSTPRPGTHCSTSARRLCTGRGGRAPPQRVAQRSAG